jgi:ATPase subunit of ABC transporter with duplicated ATPase domains
VPSPSSPATLVARAISKHFGPHLVLDRVSCTIPPGARLGIVAPNGTGKSTLLRILAGLEPADSGAVELLPDRATVGYLAQEPERRGDESVRAALARRTGVSDADTALARAAAALGDTDRGAHDRYERALDRYLALGAADFDARLGDIAADVGLAARLLDAPTGALSGGEAARVSLAAILLARFDVLLLDEPTNDLDFDGLARLEQMVCEWRGALAVVSHDRAFLERVVTDVLELDGHAHTAAEFHGGWRAYGEERATARRHAEEAHAQYVEQRDALAGRARREREWAQQGVAKVRRSGETDKFIRHFRTASSEQLAARAKRTERQLERLDVVDKPWEGWELRFDIATTDKGSARALALTDAVVVREGSSFVLGPVSVEIAAGERVHVAGANGSGKSTLIGALLGTVAMTSGLRHIGPGVRLGTLDQTRGAFDRAPTLLDGLVAATGLPLSEARSLAAKFGLGADHVTRRPATLSPGERTRAELALLMARGVNCLVLDEPTNHLDLEAIEQLESALGRFGGTLVVVSHDRRFLDALDLTRTVTLAAGKVVQDGV